MSINNVDELRTFMANVLIGVSKGEQTPASANASANIAGKILSSVKLEIDYNRLLGLAPNIKFLKDFTKYNDKSQNQIESIDKETGEVK